MDPASDDNEAHQQYHSNQSLQHNVVASTVVLLVIAVLSVVFRCYARYKSQVKLGIDDLLVGIALLPIIASAVCMLVGLGYGLGTHFATFKDDEAKRKGFYITYTLEVVWFALSTGLTKGSILCFYCRIFKSRALNRLSWALGVFVFMYNLAVILVICLQCVPLDKLWERQIPDRSRYCKADTMSAIVALGCINILTDFVILSIPVRYVVRLNMDRFRKLQVCGAFLTGTIVCVFGVVRVIAFATTRTKPEDASYNETSAIIWTFCEMCIGILAACLPTMGLLVSEIRNSAVFMSLQSAVAVPVRTRIRSIRRSRHSMTSPLQPVFYDKSPPFNFGFDSRRETRVLSMPEPPEVAQARGLLGVDIPSYRLYQRSTDLGGFVPSERSLEVEEPVPSGLLLNIRIPSYQLHRLSGNSGISIPLPWTKNYDWKGWERLQPSQDEQ